MHAETAGKPPRYPSDDVGLVVVGTGGATPGVSLFDTDFGPSRRLPITFAESVYRLQCDPSGSRLAVLSRGGELAIKPVTALVRSPARQPVISCNAASLAVVWMDTETIAIFDATGRAWLRAISSDDRPIIAADVVFRPPVVAASYSDAGPILLHANGQVSFADSRLRIDPKERLVGPRPAGPLAAACWVTDPEGRYRFYGSHSGELVCVDVEAREITTCVVASSPLTVLAAREGEVLAASGADGMISRTSIDLQQSREIKPLGARLVAGSNWATHNGQLLAADVAGRLWRLAVEGTAIDAARVPEPLQARSLLALPADQLDRAAERQRRQRIDAAIATIQARDSDAERRAAAHEELIRAGEAPLECWLRATTARADGDVRAEFDAIVALVSCVADTPEAAAALARCRDRLVAMSCFKTAAAVAQRLHKLATHQIPTGLERWARLIANDRLILGAATALPPDLRTAWRPVAHEAVFRLLHAALSLPSVIELVSTSGARLLQTTHPEGDILMLTEDGPRVTGGLMLATGDQEGGTPYALTWTRQDPAIVYTLTRLSRADSQPLQAATEFDRGLLLTLRRRLSELDNEQCGRIARQWRCAGTA